MGEAMVRRLLDLGYEVAVWNLEPERLQTVVPHGAVPADTPAQLAASSDIVMLCVLHMQAVESCIFGNNGVAAAGPGPKLVIDFSTDHWSDIARGAGRLRLFMAPKRLEG